MTLHNRTGTVAEALLDLLHSWGVRYLFSCPGSTEAPVLDALVDRRDVELVLTTHESIAVSMADGLSRISRQPAVAYLHANVGLANGIAHLYAAQLSNSPVVVLNGLKPTAIQSRAGFTTARRIRDTVAQFVKDDWQSLSADQVIEDVHRAFVRAVAEPTGPTWVGLSQNLLGEPFLGNVPSRPDLALGSLPEPAALAAAADLLAGAVRPVIVAGSEVARQGALGALTAVAERLQAEVLLEERRGLERAAFVSDHPLFRGHYERAHPSVSSADLLFFAGCRLFHEFELSRINPLPDGVPVIHSHPDPVELGRIHPVAVGLAGNQRLMMEALLELVPEARHVHTRESTTGSSQADPVSESPVEELASHAVPGTFRPVDAVRAITAAARDSIIVGDATTAGGLLARNVRITDADSFFVSSSGSLGWGLGASLGIALGRPDRPVVAVLGDGVFQFGLPGLWTAAHYHIPVAFVVLNNRRYAAVGAALRRFGGRAVAANSWPGTDISGVDIVGISKAFGIAAKRVADLTELDDLLSTGRPEPIVIEVLTDPDDFGP